MSFGLRYQMKARHSSKHQSPTSVAFDFSLEVAGARGEVDGDVDGVFAAGAAAAGSDSGLVAGAAAVGLVAGAAAAGSACCFACHQVPCRSLVKSFVRFLMMVEARLWASSVTVSGDGNSPTEWTLQRGLEPDRFPQGHATYLQTKYYHPSGPPSGKDPGHLAVTLVDIRLLSEIPTTCDIHQKPAGLVYIASRGNSRGC